MTGTHDYETRPVKPEDLDATCVLVGESGGLCAVYGAAKRSVINPTGKSGSGWFFSVETEFGFLYLPDAPVNVLVA